MTQFCDITQVEIEKLLGAKTCTFIF